jgi:hypothetical protein
MLASEAPERESFRPAGSLRDVDPEPAPPHLDGPGAVVVHSSLRGLAAGAATPLLLVVIGGAAIADGGPRLFPVALVIAGVALGSIVVGDLPRRTEFSLGGITRVCILRRQHLPWSRVLAIERTQPGTATRTRNLLDRRSSATPVVSGGLVARGRGKRRWLLTDRVESRREHELLSALVERVEAPVALTAEAPRQDAPPTDLYRRRRGRPV